MSKKKLLHGLLVGLLLATTPTFGAEQKPDGENAGRMIGDLVIARPLGLATTAVGTVAFVLSLPFTILGNNVGEAADTLVVKPASETFTRCLGCTQ